MAEPMIGTVRHVFVADTDEEADAVGRRAWAAYHGHYVRRGWSADTGPLTTSEGASRPAAGGPSLGGNYDLARQLEVALVGSPETIAAYLGRYREAAGGVNYFVGALHWGDLTHAEALHSLELFASVAGPGRIPG